MRQFCISIVSAALVAACAQSDDNQALVPAASAEPDWQVSFFDDFDSFNPENWQDQILWVNDEDQCYVRDGAHNTREVSDGTLKLRVVDLGEKLPCDNMNKAGEQHPDTQYVAGRLASKNRKEFAKGKWTARLRVENSGEPGMFPAWWLLGAYNNEPPVEEDDENVCWPMTGSGEIDIFEHHSDGGPDHYAARAIKSLGYCGGGDWQQLMLVQEAVLADYHEYSVEWQGSDLVFRLDGVEIYRNEGGGDLIPEPLFAVLNFAKINDSAMNMPEWTMEVDWVKHEYLGAAGESNDMYGLIGKMIAHDGKRDELAAILLEGTRDMPGNLSYVIANDREDDNALWITEVWDSQESHTASLTLESVQQAIGRGKPLIAGFGERIETTPVGGQGVD